MSARVCRAGALCGVLAAFLLLLAGGCADEPAPLAPITGTCLVQGAIISPRTSAAECFVRFLRTDESELSFRVLADAAGRYRTEVPAGDYTVTAYVDGLSCNANHEGGVSDSWDEPDTLRLESGALPREINFRLGVVDLDCGNLAGLDGWTVDATLCAVRDDYAYPYWSVSAAGVVDEGRLNLEVGPVIPGAYRMRIEIRRDWNQRGEGFWLPAALEFSEGTLYRVGADSLTLATTDWPAPARLTGTIPGAWRDLEVSGPTVSAFDADNVQVAGPFQVDSFGRFDLPFVRPEPVRLRVGSGPGIWVGGAAYDDATVFNLEPGVTVSGIEQAVSTVFVRTTMETVEPNEYSAQLELRDPTSQALVVSQYFRFDDAVGLTCMPPGQYLARITSTSNSRSWRSQWYDRAASPAAAALITIPASGGATMLDIVLERGGVISGTASRGQSAVNWAYAVVTREDSEEVLSDDYLSRLDRPTAFLLRGLEDGRYKVGVLFYGRADDEPGSSVQAFSWYPGTSDWTAAAVIEISGANTVSGLVLTTP